MSALTVVVQWLSLNVTSKAVSKAIIRSKDEEDENVGRENRHFFSLNALGMLRLCSGWLRDTVDASSPALDLVFRPSVTRVRKPLRELLATRAVTHASVAVAPIGMVLPSSVVALERLIERRSPSRLSISIEDDASHVLRAAAHALETAANSCCLNALKIGGAPLLFLSPFGMRAAAAIARMPSLTSLDLYEELVEIFEQDEDLKITSSLEVALAPLGSLRQLDVRNCGLDGPCTVVSRQLRDGKYEHMEKLSLSLSDASEPFASNLLPVGLKELVLTGPVSPLLLAGLPTGLTSLVFNAAVYSSLHVARKPRLPLELAMLDGIAPLLSLRVLELWSGHPVGFSPAEVDALAVALSGKQLTRLSLAVADVPEIDGALRRLAPHFAEELTSLDVMYTVVEPALMPAIMLAVDGITVVTPENIVEIELRIMERSAEAHDLSFVRELPSLKELRITGRNDDYPVFVNIASLFGHEQDKTKQKLTSLQLVCIEAHCAPRVPPACLSSLQNIVIDGVGGPDQGIDLDLLRHATALRSLRFGYALRDEDQPCAMPNMILNDMEKLLAVLQSTAIKQLTLSACGITPSIMARLSRPLGQLQTLESLDLRGNRLAPRGIELLMPVIAKLTRLRTLHLADTGATSASTRSLAPILSKLERLRKVSV